MNFLTKILEYKKQEVEVQKKESGHSIDILESLCKELNPVKSFLIELEKCKNLSRLALIAEVKKASPSKGLIRENFDPVNIAVAYEKAGANAVSVLTDERFFQGSMEYLKEIKKAVNLPILRKDFIIDSFQIYQTRLMGADMILLIASALEYSKLKDFYALSKDLGLDVLLEVHDEQEFKSAVDIGAKIIGINNRNLETFEVSIENTINIVKNKDRYDSFIVSESGINKHADIVKLQKAGISGVLVGESFMKEENIEKAVHKLMYD